ncbi:hypothetical protein GCM10022393_31980 [Aquimarina addita]|uniref:ADP,ATP carrier protein n=1 Tax=Aquimarina addita TaxID=870485 RepID=A0ABP6UNX1_9FLAO
MYQKLRSFFKQTFDIRDGEIFISLLMQMYIFLIITVLLIVKPTINALFLSKLGADHLPYGYLIVALVAIISSYFYNGIIRNFSIKTVAVFTLIGFSISFTALSALMFFSILNNWVLYFFYINVALFAVLATSQFWILANLVYNAREAKRLFGFIGAGAIAGGVFGGYLTSILASLIGNRFLILIAAILILCCIPILHKVWGMRVSKLNTYVRKQRKETLKNSGESSFKIIVKSRHLSNLALIVGISVIIAKLVDFQFSDFAHKAILDSDELASFFGFWFSSFNVIALLIQLFLTNRILGVLGVTSTLLVLPLGIAFGCLVFLTFPELWVLIIIKGMDGSFKQSINKAATELSILPIPFLLKNQAKSFIDVVVDSIATGIAGFLLIFIIRKLDLSTSYITVIILLFLFVWILLIYKLRETYFNSFRSNLQKSVSFTPDAMKDFKKETTLDSSIRILTSGNDDEILVLMDRLDHFKMKPLKQYILQLLDHSSIKIKAAAVRQLYRYDKGTASDKVQSMLHIPDDTFVLVAMEYLVLHTNLKDTDIFNTYLDHETDYIANAALLCLAKESHTNQKIGVKYNLITRIESIIASLQESKSDFRKQEIGEVLITIAYSGKPKFYSVIWQYLEHPDSYVVMSAIKAAGITKDEQFVEVLVDFLEFKQYRKTVIKALKNYGEEITRTIFKYDREENISDKVRKYIPKVIEVFKTQTSVKMLFRLLTSKDVLIRLQASKSLSTLKRGNSSLVFNQRKINNRIFKESEFYKKTISSIATLQLKLDSSKLQDEMLIDTSTSLSMAREQLIEILNSQLDQCLECIFRLLSLKYDKTDMEFVYYGIKSDSREAQMNAIEFLDNLLQIKLKSTLLPLIEYHILETDNEFIKRSEFLHISEKRCLTLLMKNRGKKIKLATIKVMRYTGDSDYAKLLIPYKKHKNIEVQDAVKQALFSLIKSKIAV